MLTGCVSEDAAKRRAAQLARIAEALRGDHRPAEAESILLRAAEAADVETLRTISLLARRIGRGEYADGGQTITCSKTFRDVAEEWTDGELHRRWPDHVKDIDHSNNIVQLEAYVYPTLGSCRLADVRRRHCDAVLRTLPEHLGPSSRKHVAQLVHRVLNLAALADYIQSSPLPRGWLPKGGPRKDVPVLYPSEDAALLGCEQVPLLYRLYYGMLHREGGRRSETAALVWGELDLENGVIQLDENKTDHARWWKVDPGVTDALLTWRDLRGSPGPDDLVFVGTNGEGLDVERMAERVREHLRLAGVTRSRLFAKGTNTLRFGTHGFRHSFTTRSLARGRTDDWVRQRTGHRSTELLTYREAARSLVELDLGDLAPLASAIPELARRRPVSAAPPEAAARAEASGSSNVLRALSAALVVAIEAGDFEAAESTETALAAALKRRASLAP